MQGRREPATDSNFPALDRLLWRPPNPASFLAPLKIPNGICR